MIYSGAELLAGEGLLAAGGYEGSWVGLFVIVLGASCVYGGVVGWLGRHGR